ncbi:hypothetical protein K2Z83_22940 [Oscillochloris sp. ZM17-4]|uniref:5'-methylthioadenosine/S-adenosylhomocysteine nucleosidase family protein n=1 Tax=Oscillochloris sp. ZM17-4 TaxID=2866714 RepID=UPI001C7337B5|nr:hypothetical protein [Oscillochloris sp. ZM17-4]MBX0330516.1 hypothetical protein [Oscillochloris sp. ZM17-4]
MTDTPTLEELDPEQAGPLRELLDGLRSGALSREEALAYVDARPELKAQISRLAGRRVRHGDSLVIIAQGPLFADVQIHGGVVGQPIFHFSLSVTPGLPGGPAPAARARRRAAYEQLFRISGALARYSPVLPLDANVLAQLSAELRDWYFGLRGPGDNVGGLYLEERCRIPFFELKDAIKEALAGRPDPAATALRPEDAARVLAAGKALRDGLRADMGALSGRPPRIQLMEPGWMPAHVDLAIVTALAEELEPVMELVGEGGLWQEFGLRSFQHRYAEIAFGPHRLHVVAHALPEMGGDATVNAVARMGILLQPRLMVMTGLCGGLGAAQIGDVVVAEAAVRPLQGGKDTAAGTQLNLLPHRLPPQLLTLLRAHADDQAWLDTLPLDHHQQRTPQVHIGVTAQSETVIATADPAATVGGRGLGELIRKLRAVDMELASFYAALSYNQVAGFGVKGVSDRADAQKGDQDRAYAARASVAWLAAFLSRAWPQLG